MQRKKILIIFGPTSSGKTELALNLAKKIKGEIVSADSRHIYQGMDIGTGKDMADAIFKLKKSKSFSQISSLLGLKDIKIGIYLLKGIPLWGLDLIKPNVSFSVYHWFHLTSLFLKNIWQRNKLPLIVGGTGFWIKTLLERKIDFMVSPNWRLRQKLNNFKLQDLKKLLKKTWPQRWQKLNFSDRNNPRRLIRAIEIAVSPVKAKSFPFLPVFNKLVIGLTASNKFLFKKINERVLKRIRAGAKKEVQNLLKKGYSFSLESMKASGYKEWQDYFAKKTDLAKVIQNWQNHEHSLARRQKLWLKKIKLDYLFDIEKKGYEKKLEKIVLNWYDKK